MKRTIEQRLQAIEDTQEITTLKARYCHYCDGGWDRAPHTYYNEIADLFIEDGVWDARPLSELAEGREAIRDLFKRLREVPFAMHFVTNPIIEVKGDTATGNWHAMILLTGPVLATGPDENRQAAYWLFGIYSEEYVRTPEGWRYKSLRMTPAIYTPYEAGWGKVRLPRQ